MGISLDTFKNHAGLTGRWQTPRTLLFNGIRAGHEHRGVSTLDMDPVCAPKTWVRFTPKKCVEMMKRNRRAEIDTAVRLRTHHKMFRRQAKLDGQDSVSISGGCAGKSAMIEEPG